MKLEAFGTWLRSQGYSASSVRKATTDVGTMVARGPTPPESQRQRQRLRDYIWAWDLYAAFVEATGADALDVPRPELPALPTVGRRLRREPKRLLEAVSIDDREWARFSRVVIADASTTARAIHVMCDTGLRVSDVLRVTRATLERGFARDDRLTQITVKGSKPVIVDLSAAEDAWRRVLEVLRGHTPHTQLAQVISPGSDPGEISGSAAYHAVRRKLFELADQTQLSGRVHLHRLRRTVTIQILRAGGSLEEAQHALGHENRRTTDTYADEARAKDAAEALRRARKRREGL